MEGEVTGALSKGREGKGMNGVVEGSLWGRWEEVLVCVLRGGGGRESLRKEGEGGNEAVCGIRYESSESCGSRTEARLCGFGLGWRWRAERGREYGGREKGEAVGWKGESLAESGSAAGLAFGV